MLPPASDCGSHHVLFEWVKHQDGFLTDKVELSQTTETGFCIRVKTDTSIPKDTLIARCPTTATLSMLNALDAPGFECHGTSFPSSFLQLSSFTVQCFFLIDQYQYGNKSYWFPYFQILPQPSQTGRYTPFEEGDLEWLEGTNLAPALLKRLNFWRTEFDSGLKLLRQSNWRRATDTTYSWDLFRWAAMVYSSRGFSSAVLGETYAADIARPFGKTQPQHQALNKAFQESFAVLIPVLDMLNYRPIVQVEWQANANYVGLQVLENLDPGQEVCNNYGPKDNENLILGYGFAIALNPFDCHTIGFSVPLGSPLEAAHKHRERHQESRKEYSYHIFNPSHPVSKRATTLHDAVFSHDLLDAVSILSANTIELQSRTFQEHYSFMNSSRDERFGRLMFNTVAQLLAECRVKAQLLRSKDPSSMSQLPVNQMQKYAKVYRDSQLEIVEAAVEVCTYYLDIGRACRSVRPPSPMLESFLSRAPPSVSSAELFDFDSLLEQFWSPLETAIRLIAEALSNAVTSGSTVDVNLQDVIVVKLKYAVALYLFRSCHGSAVNSPRARRWVDSMARWYSTSSIELCSPSEEFAKPLEAIMDADTDQARKAYEEIGTWVVKQSDNEWEESWWDPAKLCWAWNVVEEEGVQLPEGPYLIYILHVDESILSE